MSTPVTDMRRRLAGVPWWCVATALAAAVVVVLGNERYPAPPQAGALGGLAPPTDTAPRRLRLATFNIDTGHRRSGELDLTSVARALRGVDFAALQEVDGPRPWRGPDQANEIGKLLGASSAFAPTERRWWMDHVGNAIVSRRMVPYWMSMPLAGTQRRGHRNLVLAHVPLENGTVVNILSTHLDRRRDRKAQLEAVARLFLSLAEPAVLMGDLNTPREELKGLLADKTKDALDDAGVTTSPARIDWILLRGLRGVAGGEVTAEVSDHPCYWADVEIVRPAPEASSLSRR